MKAKGHKLELFTTTKKQAGEHVTTGHCKCGWHTESAFQREVKAEYQKHIAQVKEGK